MKFLSLSLLCAALALEGCNGAGVPPPAARDAATASGAGASNETVLHSFGGPDGAGATTGLIAGKNGVFYGTTAFGGAGAGTVFKLTPSASGYTESVIYSFKGGLDGSVPEGMIERHGVFYGVTFVGGDPSGNGGAGWGTIFKLAPAKSGYVESVLYRFQGDPNAWEPNGPIVMDAAGTIYGSTGPGGSHNFGTIFKVFRSGSSFSESVIYSFPGGSGGQEPQAGLTIDKHGSIYGTTMYGGSNVGRPCKYPGCGTVFKLEPTGSSYTERVIYAFHGDRDGDLPYGVLTVDDRTGDVYGTTYWGGRKGNGSVFKLRPKGSGYTEAILHGFKGKSDGFLPEGTLLLKRDGTLYGTAALGGGGCSGIGCGAVFSLVPSGTGYAFHVIYDFREPKRGAEPEQTNLIADASGALYGTTRSGGTQTSCTDGGPGGATGCGVVFKIVP